MLPISQPDVSIDDKTVSIARSLAALIIARMISTGELDPSRIRSRRKLLAVLDKLGRTSDSAFEIHVEHLPKRINSIRLAMEADDPQSAVVLLHTLVEGEINTAVRLLLRIRGFSHSAITEAIGGTDLKSKLDVLLPLLGAQPSARIRQLAFESQGVRNAIVHFKAKPMLAYDSVTHEGDHAVSVAKAAEFLGRNPIESISKELEPFVEVCAAKCPEFQRAHKLLERYLA